MKEHIPDIAQQGKEISQPKKWFLATFHLQHNIAGEGWWQDKPIEVTMAVVEVNFEIPI
jgi:hypothetical protein